MFVEFKIELHCFKETRKHRDYFTSDDVMKGTSSFLKAVITGDTVTRLSIPIRGRGNHLKKARGEIWPLHVKITNDNCYCKKLIPIIFSYCFRKCYLLKNIFLILVTGHNREIYWFKHLFCFGFVFFFSFFFLNIYPNQTITLGNYFPSLSINLINDA